MRTMIKRWVICEQWKKSKIRSSIGKSNYANNDQTVGHMRTIEKEIDNQLPLKKTCIIKVNNDLHFMFILSRKIKSRKIHINIKDKVIIISR
jgi:hypothetical protein